MTMRKWQHVNTDQLNNPRKSSIRGVDVTVYFGQDDMPAGVRGGFNPERNRFVIEFDYQTEPEPRKVVRYDTHIRLHVGRWSNRIFEIEIDTVAMNVQAIRLLPQVQSVLDKLKNQPENESRMFGLDRIDNYAAASGAFEQVLPALQAELAGA
jgi:DNA polymerase II small subunit/DNA polymerase delta subunit B